jgi:hypothetical protein
MFTTEGAVKNIINNLAVSCGASNYPPSFAASVNSVVNMLFLK